MPTREILSAAQRARLTALPEMDERELVRQHTLSDADLTAVGVRRGAPNRLRFAVQLCLLRYPGRPLKADEVVPRPIVEFVASQVGADPDAFANYAGGSGGAGRDTTRREHVAEIVRTFGLRAGRGSSRKRWRLHYRQTKTGGTEEMRRIYAAMEDELLVVDGVERPRTDRRLEGRKPRCLAADPLRPGVLYCGTAESRLWRSADAGASWEPAGEGIRHLAVTAVAVSAAERVDGRGVVYTGTEPSTLLRSEDGGSSWRELERMRDLPSSTEWSFPPKPETSHVRWISPDPTTPGRLFVCIEAGALIRSQDGGETWQDRVPDGPLDTHTLAVRGDAPGRLYSAAGDGLFSAGRGYSESPDAGESWTRPDGGLAHHYLWGLAVDPADPDTVIVSAASGVRQAHSPDAAESTVYRRETGGQWQEARSGLPQPEGTIVSVLAADEAEPGTFYALNNHGVYRSEDGGKEWEHLEVSWPERYRHQHPQALLVTEDAR